MVVKVDISCQNITSLLEVNWSKYVTDINSITVLHCQLNKLINLDGCPQNLQKLDCSYNKLTSLKGSPQNLQILHCSNNKLTSLEGCSQNLQELYCKSNKLTNLKYCPPNIQILDYEYRKLTSLEGCPKSYVSEVIKDIDPFLLYEDYNKLKNEINKLKNENEEKNKLIKEQYEFIEHLKYSPVGYEQAKDDFNILKNNLQ